ncbi:hypothetical protein [Streptomyces canus]|uniref:hypothetical protein n=1 Tax=Streptomyces canus TaxID=58343 RepID=UPI003865BB48
MLDRLQPHTDRIGDLTRHLARTGGGAVLHIVCHFNDTDQGRLFLAAPGPRTSGEHMTSYSPGT